MAGNTMLPDPVAQDRVVEPPAPETAAGSTGEASLRAAAAIAGRRSGRAVRNRGRAACRDMMLVYIERIASATGGPHDARACAVERGPLSQPVQPAALPSR
ncbi:hypothetical protein LHK_02649 [Laribacter hongkongensis HLHK9]|uniref:Uncharacterized protein n=1 Tax=Laribacter hongkongensis (strain HLHK9) TaxID=557598 RepID=C1DCL1_LARHH|nr:hypothetical protein LHK_02649 [Laribacter hongkongensis HLHK9]